MIYSLLLLLFVLGGLILFALQNLSPVAINFLGMQTVGLPLGFLIIGAIGTGFLTALLIFGLFQFSNYLSEQSLRARIRELETERSRNRWQRSETPPVSERTYYSTKSNASQWETTAPVNDDYVEQKEEVKETIQDKPSDRDYVPQNTTYERPQEPTSSSQSGSTYSYSYQSPKNSSVGKREPVYDAEYRIITPPYQAPEPTVTENDADWESQNNNNDDDDWGFDDDEFDDDNDDTKNRSPYR